MKAQVNPADFVSRRDFIKQMQRIGIGTALMPVAFKAMALFGGKGVRSAMGANQKPISIPADYWTKQPGTRNVKCTLCPRNEILKPGQTGYCRLRRNVNGRLITYGSQQPCILNVDPIGKNPLFNFYPKMTVLSIAHAGCNLRCLYCQNWQYAQKSPLRTKNIQSFNEKETVTRIQNRGIGGISFTYTEPVCCPEFVSAFAAYCGKFGLKRTLCTAGFVNKRPFKRLLTHFEAITITFKGFDDGFYRKVVGGTTRPVLDAMVTAKNEGKWLEVATLIVPSLNDGKKQLRDMAGWIRDNLGTDTPWLIEKFEPQYKLTRLPPTSQSMMETARHIGLDAGLKFVYISNLAPHSGNHTYCPSCHRVVIKRMGFKVLQYDIVKGRCGTCGTQIPGVWI